MQYTSESFRISSVDNLRIPTALMLATLLTAALFWALWSMTNDEIDLPQIRVIDIIYKPQKVDTDIKTIRDELNDREPPPVVPEFARTQVIDYGTVKPGPGLNPPIGPKGPVIDRGSLPVRIDGEVMPIVKVNPDYPPRAITQGIEGWVRVRFTVSAIGTVKDAIIVESSSNIFEAAALKAVARWRYNPKVENGVGVERVGMETLFRFDLDD